MTEISGLSLNTTEEKENIVTSCGQQSCKKTKDLYVS